MKNIQVSICTGTSCYLSGAAHLLLLDDMLDPYLKQHVEIRGAHCLGLCNKTENGKPPYAKMNDQIVANANITKVLAAIHEEIEKNDSNVS